MKKACVIGWPIGHSRSPLIHNYWLKLHGIEGAYEKLAVEPSSLAPSIRGLAERGYAGCNVTIPHKEAAFGLVEIADEATRRLGVVNTIFLRDGKPYGTNTDGDGFIANLLANSKSLALKNSRVVLLGAGGAAMAVVGALLDHGAAEIAVANRTLERATFLGKKFGPAVVPLDWNSRASALTDCSLFVNTTALGMTGQQSLDIDLRRLPVAAVVTDIVYTPLETPLLRQARARGNETVGGLGMLLHQGVRGFELWFGAKPHVTPELYDLVARDIDPDYRR